MECSSLATGDSFLAAEPRPASPLCRRESSARGEELTASLAVSEASRPCGARGGGKLSLCISEDGLAGTEASDCCCCCAAEEAGGVVSVRSTRKRILQRVLQQLAASRARWIVRAASAWRRQREASAEVKTGRCRNAEKNEAFHTLSPLPSIGDSLFPPPLYAAVALPAHSAVGCLQRQQRLGISGVSSAPGSSLIEAVLRQGGGAIEAFEALGETRVSVASAAAEAACNAVASGDAKYIHSANAAAAEAWAFLGIGGSETPPDTDFLPVATHGVGLAGEGRADEAWRVQAAVSLYQQLKVKSLALRLRLGKASEAERVLPLIVAGSEKESEGAACSLALASALLALRGGHESAGLALLQLALRRAAALFAVTQEEAGLARFEKDETTKASAPPVSSGLSHSESLRAAVAAAGRATTVYAEALERRSSLEGPSRRGGTASEDVSASKAETSAGGVAAEERLAKQRETQRRRLWSELLALNALGIISLHLALLLENRPELHSQVYVQSLAELLAALRESNRAALANSLDSLVTTKAESRASPQVSPFEAVAARFCLDFNGDARIPGLGGSFDSWRKLTSPVVSSAPAAKRRKCLLDQSSIEETPLPLEAAALRLAEGDESQQGPLAKGAPLECSCSVLVDNLIALAEECGQRMAIATATKSRPLGSKLFSAQSPGEGAFAKGVAPNPASGSAASVEMRQRRLGASLRTQSLLTRASVCLQRHCKVGLPPSTASRRELESLLLSLLQRLVRALCAVGVPPSLRSSTRRIQTAGSSSAGLVSAAPRPRPASSLQRSVLSSGALSSFSESGRAGEEDALLEGFDVHTASATLQLLLYASASGMAGRTLPHGVLLALALVLCPSDEGGNAFWRAKKAASAAALRPRSIDPLFSAWGREDKGQGPAALASSSSTESSNTHNNGIASRRGERPQSPLHGKRGRALYGKLMLLHRAHGEAELALATLTAAAFSGRDLWIALPRLASFPLAAAGDVAALSTREEIRVANSLGCQVPTHVLSLRLSRVSASCSFTTAAEATSASWRSESSRDVSESLPRVDGGGCWGCRLAEDGALQALLLRLDIQLEALAGNGLCDGDVGTSSWLGYAVLLSLSVAKTQVHSEAERLPLLLREAVCEALLRRPGKLVSALRVVEERLRLRYSGTQTLPASLSAECLYMRAMACSCAASSLLSNSENRTFGLNAKVTRSPPPKLEFPLSDPRPSLPASVLRERTFSLSSEKSRSSPRNHATEVETEAASFERGHERRFGRRLASPSAEPLRKKLHVEHDSPFESSKDVFLLLDEQREGPRFPRQLAASEPCAEAEEALETATQFLRAAAKHASQALALWKGHSPAVGLWGGLLQRRRRKELHFLILSDIAIRLRRLCARRNEADESSSSSSSSSCSELDSLREEFLNQRRALEEEDGGIASWEGAASEAEAPGLGVEEASASRKCGCTEQRLACCCWGGLRGAAFGCCCAGNSLPSETLEAKMGSLPCRRQGLASSAVASQSADLPSSQEAFAERRPERKRRRAEAQSAVSLRSAPWITEFDSQQLAAALTATLRSQGENLF